MSMEGLQSKNLVDLNFSVFQAVCNDLDIDLKWRDLVACADGTEYQLDVFDVEKCARVLHSSGVNGSPAEKLLSMWGHNGMTVSRLVQLLDKLRMEHALLLLRQPESLKITKQPVSKMRQTEGDTLILDCEAVGFPYPRYVWFKEQRKICVTDTGKLVIQQLTCDDSGKYICRIEHNYKTNEPQCIFTTWCYVNIEPGLTQPANLQRLDVTSSLQGCLPFIQYHPQSVRVYQGQTFVLTCTAIAQPSPLFQWRKDGQMLSSCTGPVIQVPNCGLSSTGNYDCFVTNVHGTTLSNIARVCVEPVINIQVPVAPQILVEPEDMTKAIGSLAWFHVKAEYPTPLKYQWFHNNNVLANETCNELRVEVDSTAVAGRYQCLIQAPDTTQRLSKEVQLIVTTTPTTFTAADKVMLIIGISTYRSYGQPLPAIPNDLQETVKAFQKMQFKVISLLDLTLTEMINAVDMFCDLLSPDVYAVFYCAGHGFIHNGRHYLIPWDACHGTDLCEALCVEDVEEKIQRRVPKLLVLFLDICRKKVEHVNNEHAIPDSLVSSDIRKLPNKVAIYAASEGEQAFEESKQTSNLPRGIFNHFFLRALCTPDLTCMRLYCALVDMFKRCRYDRDKFPQHPEIHQTLEEHDRSLWDPIDPRKHKALRLRQTLHWETLHKLPSDRVVTLPDGNTIQLSFTSVASNVLSMMAVPSLPHGHHVDINIFDTDIPNALRPLTRIIQLRDDSTYVTTFRFPNLQRLQGELCVKLDITLMAGVKGDKFVTPSIQLGRPLFATLRQCISNPGGNPGGIQGGKQPTEHTEEQTSLTDHGAL